MRMERHGLSRKIQRGKITLNQSVDLLGDFHQSKGAFGPEKISDKFKINKDVARNNGVHVKEIKQIQRLAGWILFNQCPTDVFSVKVNPMGVNGKYPNSFYNIIPWQRYILQYF